MPPETIAIVLDPQYGSQLFELAKRGPVWITPSEANRTAVAEYWANRPTDGNDVTIWSEPRTGESEEEWLGILDDVEVHHSEVWDGPGIAGVLVIGAPLSIHSEAALREYGYMGATARQNGFVAVRTA